jgi:hypothetical protein
MAIARAVFPSPAAALTSAPASTSTRDNATSPSRAAIISGVSHPLANSTVFASAAFASGVRPSNPRPFAGAT